MEIPVPNNYMDFLEVAYGKTYMEYPPEYIALFKKYNIQWFDNQTIEEFVKNDDYFKNLSHLNKKGASAYTSYIISQIKEAI